MIILLLNDIRLADLNDLVPVARADTEDEMYDFIESEIVNKYIDGMHTKYFRKGGPLEWYRPPLANHDKNIIDVGTKKSWAVQAMDDWEERVMSIPTVQEVLHLITEMH